MILTLRPMARHEAFRGAQHAARPGRPRHALLRPGGGLPRGPARAVHPELPDELRLPAPALRVDRDVQRPRPLGPPHGRRPDAGARNCVRGGGHVRERRAGPPLGRVRVLPRHGGARRGPGHHVDPTLLRAPLGRGDRGAERRAGRPPPRRPLRPGPCIRSPGAVMYPNY
jgi:hypothetical protein